MNKYPVELVNRDTRICSATCYSAGARHEVLRRDVEPRGQPRRRFDTVLEARSIVQQWPGPYLLRIEPF